VKETDKMKTKLLVSAVAVLALSPPALYAGGFGNGFGQAALNGLVSGTVQAAINRPPPQPQTVVVEKRVIVHDHTTVVRDPRPTKKVAKADATAAPTVAPVLVAPTPAQQQVLTAPVTPMPVTIVAATPVPTPNDRPTRSDASN
jgi:hypothetical protein